MALATALLLAAGLLLDAGTRAIGLWAYVAFFLVGGAASTLTPWAVARLPRPGRVIVARETVGATEMAPAFRRFLDVSVIAYVGSGLLPSLSLYALSILGLSAGFAVALSGVAAAGALAGSVLVGTFLIGGSSSHVLRTSFLLRAVAAVCCALAFPVNPLAPALLLIGSALFNGAGNAGVLATNERLYRLAPPQARVYCQSRFVGATALAASMGAVICATTLTVAPPAGWAAYAALYAGSGISRAMAAWRTEVSASWRSPIAPAEASTPGGSA